MSDDDHEVEAVGPIAPRPSVNTTQHPSPLRVLRNKFEGDMYVALRDLDTKEARDLCDTMHGSDYAAAWPKTIDANALSRSDRFTVDFNIIDTTARAGTSPKSAVQNLNATIQAKLHKWNEIITCVRDLDPLEPKHFSVTYNEKDRAFICSMPDVLVPVFYKAYIKGEFDFTGDDAGNKWKLCASNHVYRSRKQKKTSDSMAWFHAIPDSDTALGPASVFNILDRHLSQCGIIPDSTTFTTIATKDKEQGQNKYHVDFDYDPAKLPKDARGMYDLSSIKKIPISDHPLESQFIKLWAKKESMLFMFGGCDRCFKHKATACLCPEETGNRKRTPTVSNDAARRRIAARASAAHSSSFSF